MAFNWWEAVGGAAAGATAGAVIGAGVFGPLGALAGAGIGALAGFIGASLPQLFGSAPSTSSNTTLWKIYAEDAFTSISQQSQLITDQEINQVNLMQQAQMPFVVTAQKWEQVNFNANISPTTPYEFYSMLQQTGFLGYASKLVGGTQSLWITEQSVINSVNQQINKYGYLISYNVNPNETVSYTPDGEYVIIVVGYVNVSGVSVSEFTSSNQMTNVSSTTLSSGVYIIYGTSTSSIRVNPNQGMVLAFQYSSNSYTPVAWGFAEPDSLKLTYNYGTLNSSTLPQPSEALILAVEQVAVSMLGAAQAEYSVLKEMGYTSSNQIPINMTLPTIDINLGNFSNFTSSLQAYNLYLAMYIRELLQLEQTLENLSASGKLAGLQQLSFNVSNPLSLYGQYGGFIENGSIVLPNGQELHGLFLIQPYGGPLTLGSNGGTIGSGGAIAYNLIPVGNGTYALGEEYTLPSGTIVGGHVLNPGTLGTVNNPQKSYYLNASTYQMPYTQTTPSSLSTAFSNLLRYLESNPIALLATIFFVLIIVVVIIRAIA
jgi:hypothetical protein